jgi:hypothetical protein
LTVEQSARRRIARRLLPFLWLLYAVAFLDRVNVAYAALDMSAISASPIVYSVPAREFSSLVTFSWKFLEQSSWSAGARVDGSLAS